MERTNQQASTSATPKVAEFSVRAPKDSEMSLQLMNFAKHLNFNFHDVNKAQLWLEDDAHQESRKEAKPQGGAGSQFGAQTRVAPKARTSKPKNQPYTLKTKFRNGELKKYKSMREGGLMERSVYYVMINGERGFEAYPLEEWHTFRPAPMENPIGIDEIEDLLKKQSQGMQGLEKKFKSFKSSTDDKDCSDNFSSDDESDRETEKQRNKSRRRNNKSADGVAEGSDNEDLEEKEVDYAGESELESDGEENQSAEITDVDSENEADDDFVECSENECDEEEPLQTGRKRKAEEDYSDQQRPRKRFH